MLRNSYKNSSKNKRSKKKEKFLISFKFVPYHIYTSIYTIHRGLQKGSFKNDTKGPLCDIPIWSLTTKEFLPQNPAMS